ncbi:MAG: hypothetical protein ACREMI_04220 [Gemmatimonadales bacterium]
MSARAILRACIVASVFTAACGDPSEPRLPGFSVSPGTQWSGDTITIRSRYFVDRNPLPVQLLVGAATPSSLAMVVYRASTLELLGILPTPDACPDMQAGPCFSGVVSVDDAHDRAYIVTPGDPTPIWTFALLP